MKRKLVHDSDDGGSGYEELGRETCHICTDRLLPGVLPFVRWCKRGQPSAIAGSSAVDGKFKGRPGGDGRRQYNPYTRRRRLGGDSQHFGEWAYRGFRSLDSTEFPGRQADVHRWNLRYVPATNGRITSNSKSRVARWQSLRTAPRWRVATWRLSLRCFTSWT